MTALTETEILDRHTQSLHEARQACQFLARQADPELLAPRGRHYQALKEALALLEGTCRQMAAFRDDARWLRLGMVYAKAMRLAQVKFVGQRWAAFGTMMGVFDNGLRNMTDLKDQRTGRRGMILPSRPSDWLVMPDFVVPQRGPWRTVH